LLYCANKRKPTLIFCFFFPIYLFYNNKQGRVVYLDGLVLSGTLSVLGCHRKIEDERRILFPVHFKISRASVLGSDER
jgi:hypothetical protein